MLDSNMEPKKSYKTLKTIGVGLCALLAGLVLVYAIFPTVREEVSYKMDDNVVVVAPTPSSASQIHSVADAPPPTKSECDTNKLGIKKIIVSLSKQHLWACDGASQVYDTAVTTGAYKVNDDGTPTGTWKIYKKKTDQYLQGPGYKDFVNYWMPFYGAYGFHDATWQTFPFGSPLYATQGSHGCVHLSLASAKWIFDWSAVGTIVTVQK